MLTLNQWKDIRRVDLVNLGLGHARFRAQEGGQRADLKQFDALVTAYHLATNEQDRATALGEIIIAVHRFTTVGGALANRYRDAAASLQTSALNDLRAMCHNVPLNSLALTLRYVDEHRALAIKNVDVNVYYIVAIGNEGANNQAVDQLIDQHINTANGSQSLRRAGIRMRRVGQQVTNISNYQNNSLLLAGNAVPQPLRGMFQDSAQGGERLIDAMNAANNNGIDVVYVDGFDQADVQGRTFRAGANYTGHTPARPIITLTLNPQGGLNGTYRTTLLHELGHALTSDSGHSTRADNLMASGALRNGTDNLSAGQIAWFRSSPFAV